MRDKNKSKTEKLRRNGAGKAEGYDYDELDQAGDKFRNSSSTGKSAKHYTSWL